MTSEDKRWDRLKADYLGKVEKALSSVQHPRRNEVLEDVRAHLERRFAELAPEQHTVENLETIITEMGPASDYAELLEPQALQPTGYLQRKYVLWFGLAVIVIAAVIVPLSTARTPKYKIAQVPTAEARDTVR